MAWLIDSDRFPPLESNPDFQLLSRLRSFVLHVRLAVNEFDLASVCEVFRELDEVEKFFGHSEETMAARLVKDGMARCVQIEILPLEKQRGALSRSVAANFFQIVGVDLSDDSAGPRSSLLTATQDAMVKDQEDVKRSLVVAYRLFEAWCQAWLMTVEARYYTTNQGN